MAGVKNSLVAKKQTFSAYLTQDAIKNRINAMIGGKDGQRFIASIVSAVSINPVLAECDYGTIFSAAMLGESLKLSPSPQLGQYYMVPYEDKKRGTKVAQFQMGANGYKQLAMRSGQYLDIDCIEIKQGEMVGRDKATGKYRFEFLEDDESREELPTVGYLAYFELLNGFKKTIYWSRAKMESHADTYSKAFSLEKYRLLRDGKIPSSELWKYSSFWYKNFPAMAEKTMIKHILSKWGILSIEMQQAIERDDAMMREDGSFEYVDNTPDDSQTIDVTPTPPVADPEPPADPDPQSAQDSFFE